MQTFLPYPCFRRSAAVLDDRRLGKQRVEALQVLRALHLDGYGWANHPAVLMWRGHSRALVAYGLAVVEEWCHRGHSDTTRPNIVEFACPREPVAETDLPPAELPPWLGLPELHRSHRSALVRKDPALYRAVFPDASPMLPYVWPEPPAAADPQKPLSAWVVRAPSTEVLGVFRAEGLVGLPATFADFPVRSKKQRQFTRLHHASTGGRVVVPEGATLHCGRLRGGVIEREIADEPYVTRTVVWDRTLSRSSLQRPYQLQDPQLMFPLRGECVLGA